MQLHSGSLAKLTHIQLGRKRPNGVEKQRID